MRLSLCITWVKENTRKKHSQHCTSLQLWRLWWLWECPNASLSVCLYVYYWNQELSVSTQELSSIIILRGGLYDGDSRCIWLLVLWPFLAPLFRVLLMSVVSLLCASCSYLSFSPLSPPYLLWVNLSPPFSFLFLFWLFPFFTLQCHKKGHSLFIMFSSHFLFFYLFLFMFSLDFILRLSLIFSCFFMFSFSFFSFSHLLHNQLTSSSSSWEAKQSARDTCCSGA